MSILNEMPKEEMLLDIKELLRSVEKLKARAERAERERDAAIFKACDLCFIVCSESNKATPCKTCIISK